MDKDKLRLMIYEKYSDGEISLDQREILLERVNDLVLSENMNDDDFYATEGLVQNMLKDLSSSVGGVASTLTKGGKKAVTGSVASRTMNSAIDANAKGLAQRKMDRMHYRRPETGRDIKVTKKVIDNKGARNNKTKNPMHNIGRSMFSKSKKSSRTATANKNFPELSNSATAKKEIKSGHPSKVNNTAYNAGHTANVKKGKAPDKITIYRYQPSDYAIKYQSKIKKLENKYRKIMKGAITVGSGIVKGGMGVGATIGLIHIGIVPVVATTVGAAAIGIAATFGKSFKGMANDKAQKDLDKAEIRLKRQHDKLLKEREKIIEKGEKHLLSPDQLRKASRRWEKRSLAFVKDCDKVKDRYNKVRAQVSAKANGNTSFIKTECGFTVADNGDYVYEDGSIYNNKPATEYGLMNIVNSIKYESPNSDRVYEVVDFVIENANLDNNEDYEAYMECVSIFENSSVFDD